MTMTELRAKQKTNNNEIKVKPNKSINMTK